MFGFWKRKVYFYLVNCVLIAQGHKRARFSRALYGEGRPRLHIDSTFICVA